MRLYVPIRHRAESADAFTQLIYVNYTGVVTVTDAERDVLTGKTEDGSTPFGNSCKSLLCQDFADFYF